MLIDCADRKIFMKDGRGGLEEIPLHAKYPDRDTREPISSAPAPQAPMSGFSEAKSVEGAQQHASHTHVQQERTPKRKKKAKRAGAPQRVLHAAHRTRIAIGGTKAERKAYEKEQWLKRFHAAHQNSDFRKETMDNVAQMVLSAWHAEGGKRFPAIPSRRKMDVLVSAVRNLGVQPVSETAGLAETEGLEEKKEASGLSDFDGDGDDATLPSLLSESESDTDTDSGEEESRVFSPLRA